MINIIVNSDPRYNINRMAIKNAVLETLQKNKVFGKVEVGKNIVGDMKMHELNQKYRGIDSTTDILSFALEEGTSSSLQHIPRIGFVPSPDKVLRLGDIIISYPQALEHAEMDHITVDEEIRTLVEDGINHLLGIHHV